MSDDDMNDEGEELDFQAMEWVDEDEEQVMTFYSLDCVLCNHGLPLTIRHIIKLYHAKSLSDATIRTAVEMWCAARECVT